jgi:cell division transport system permease protein
MIRQWLTQHRLAVVQVLARMWRTRLSMLMMMGVIGIALCLPAMLYVTIENVQRMTGGLDDTPQISLFLALDAPAETIKELDQRLRQHADIAGYRFVGRDDAWQQLQQQSNLADIGGGLERNPLPDAYIIEPRHGDPNSVEKLQREMQQWPGVEHALLDAAWVKRLHALLQLGQKAVMVIAGLLGFALLAITGNSIRLQIMTQREEIELARLIGATDRFIRRPFLYAGSLYGLGGGVAALLMLQATVWLFNLSIADLAEQYASDFRLTLPAADLALGLLGISALLGWIGAYWSVERSLANLDSSPQ